MQPGVVYYKIVSSPIDLTMIKQKIELREYTTNSAQLEQDFLQVFANGRRFDVVSNTTASYTSARARACEREAVLR